MGADMTEGLGLRDITKKLICGEYDPYDYCFHGLGMLAHETESEQIMTPAQYERLWASDFKALISMAFSSSVSAASIFSSKS